MSADRFPIGAAEQYERLISLLGQLERFATSTSCCRSRYYVSFCLKVFLYMSFSLTRANVDTKV